MFLFAQIQLHDHSSVFGVAEVLFAIAAELSVCLCHIAAQRLLLCCLASLLPVRRQGHVCMNGSDLLLQLGAQPCKHLLMLRLHLLRCFGLRDR